MIKKLRLIKKVTGKILSGLILALLIYAIFSTFMAAKTGQPASFFGYRPVLILSGSMEPEIKTNGIVITHEVKSLDNIEKGDVITFTVPEEDNMLVTHRITDITKDGIITTKGDNNRVADLYPTTINEVQSKVVLIFNQTAWIVDTWNSGNSGKVTLITFAIAAIIVLILILIYLHEIAEKVIQKLEAREASTINNMQQDT